jgi:hypothetical protein
MQVVGHHLQTFVQKTIDKSELDRDLFARSAYNRYYYACVFIIREALTEIDNVWKRTPHKSYSEIFNGTITKRLKKEKMRAKKIEDTDLEKRIDEALRSIHEIVKIIEISQSIRGVADYEPNVKISFDNQNRFSLNEIDITKAHHWEPHLRILLVKLMTVWRQFND